MSHWNKIKIPSYGKSDGMVRFENGTFEQFRERVFSILKQQIPNRYYKYVSLSEYAEKNIGSLELGKIYQLKADNPLLGKWEIALDINKYCFEASTKMDYNLNRDHGTPKIKQTNNFDWDKYEKSIKSRANELRNNGSSI